MIDRIYKCRNCDCRFRSNDNLERHYIKCIYYRYNRLGLFSMSNRDIDNVMLISNLLLLSPDTTFVTKNQILHNLNLRLKLNKKNERLIRDIYFIIEGLYIEIIEYQYIINTISKFTLIPIESVIALNELFYS